MGISIKHLTDPQRVLIARQLFQVKHEEPSKGEIHGYCPIHQESEQSPSPSFSYNYKKDSYHCFSCGADGDLIKLWTEVKGYSQTEGFKSFCETYGIPIGKDAPDHKAKKIADEPAVELSIEDTLDLMRQAWDKFPSLPSDWIARLEKERGWTAETINALDLRLQTYRLDKGSGLLRQIMKPLKIAIPIKNEHGSLMNIRLYQPGAKQYKIISFAQSTGESRLFPSGFRDEVDVLLCEGESDTVCALSHDFNAGTQTSKLKKWPLDHIKHFKGKNVVIAYDADHAGQVYAEFAAENLNGEAKSVRLITWPDFMGVGPDGSVPKDHGQDLTDFFVRHGKSVEDFNKLIEAAKPWKPSIPPPPPDDDDDRDDGIYRFFDYGVNKRYSFKPRLLANKIIEDKKLMYDPKTGTLYIWNGVIWKEFDQDHLEKMAILYLENESQKSRVADAVFQALKLCTMPDHRSINDHVEWLCLQNGMFNYVTYEFASHDPEFYCTQALPVSLDPDSKKRCERFERFLETNIQTPEVIAQVQEYAGYILTRHAKFKKCLLLLGPGDDGKSKLIDILSEMVGLDNCSAVAFQDLEKEFNRSHLYEKMLNISTEVGSDAIESQYFKAITSGDPMDAAFKHVDNFTFKPYCKLIFAGNFLPRIKDNSEAVFGRILPVQFKMQFPEGHPERDPDLLDKLKLELSEIFYWALCGLKRLTEKKRFTDCEETQKLLQGYRRSNNPVLCYIEDRCEFGDDKEVTKDEIYLDYKKYCDRFGYKLMNKENFLRELYSAKRVSSFRPRTEGGSREQKVKGVDIIREPQL